MAFRQNRVISIEVSTAGKGNSMRPIRSNLLKGGLLVTAAALALVGCGSSNSSKDAGSGTPSQPIVIGETSDLAGPTASYFGGME
jgi:hypothetical protein